MLGSCCSSAYPYAPPESVSTPYSSTGGSYESLNIELDQPNSSKKLLESIIRRFFPFGIKIVERPHRIDIGDDVFKEKLSERISFIKKYFDQRRINSPAFEFFSSNETYDSNGCVFEVFLNRGHTIQDDQSRFKYAKIHVYFDSEDNSENLMIKELPMQVKTATLSRVQTYDSFSAFIKSLSSSSCKFPDDLIGRECVM